MSEWGKFLYHCYLLTSIIIIPIFSVRLLTGVEIINHQIFTKSQVNGRNCCRKHIMKTINGQAIPMKVSNTQGIVGSTSRASDVLASKKEEVDGGPHQPAGT